MRDGPALFFPGHHLKCDDKGRREDAVLAMIQWQNGRPVAIYPQEIAVAQAIWRRWRSDCATPQPLILTAMP